ncbi:kinase-like protein [Exidia glandulosa HHB12029]|uniref:Kinase-like protein n=1 Tax=Exidia glandulosa HHB12029 TaxID=1314781 RepID=A0A165MH71_EXIGL|nr:kinase-like protein [Exidia glandulosa HHB12029]
MSDFDVIPFEDIKGNWKKLGAGSFGNVYKAQYLGIDVAVKEVLPSTEYDVAKYFEREWRLMKEARHPNVVLYLGLSRAPQPDNRIFIVSEFIENGNLRLYIHDKTKPFPWRLRLSFATDISRALAYLHARKCIHRDLKGENLLVTANGRLKITDFGFARIAARNAEESKRLTFCGTDSYMSPEILLGHEFDLPTDIFSLGVIFCEIVARKLADDNTFKRTAPSFGIDESEIRERASPGCPPELIKLALDCLAEQPSKRPTMREILARLRDIELEVLARPEENETNMHVGSVKLLTGARSKRPAAPRIPSFGQGIGKGIRSGSNSEDDTDDELADAVDAIDLDLRDSSLMGAHGHHLHLTSDSGNGTARPLIDLDSPNGSMMSDYSTTVIKKQAPAPPALSSILTIKSPTQPNESPNPAAPPVAAPPGLTASELPHTPALEHDEFVSPRGARSEFTIGTYHTARSVVPSIAAATDGGSSFIAGGAQLHRFTLIRPGRKSTASGNSTSSSTPSRSEWNPLEFLFGLGTGTAGAKCDLCSKRLGFRPLLECDDCGLRAHVKCGETAPRDCAVRAGKA